MNAIHSLKNGSLVLKLPRKGYKSIKTIVYNLREGKQEDLDLDTLEHELSTKESFCPQPRIVFVIVVQKVLIVCKSPP